MVDSAHLFASLLEEEFDPETFDPEPLRRTFDRADRREFEAQIYNLLKHEINTDLYVTDAKGVVLFDSRNKSNEGKVYRGYRDVALTLKGFYGARSSRGDEEDKYSSVMFVGAPIYRDQEIVGMVSVSKPQASMWGFIEETQRKIRHFGWVIFGCIALGAILVSHLGSRPLRKLTDYARAVRSGKRAALPKLESHDARTLGCALEEMRDSLEDRKYVESYVQTLTHEMKSPVSAIRGAAELLREGGMPAEQQARFLANISNETERLQNIIDRLLALSAIESMKNLENPEEIDVGELVDQICASHFHAFEARRIHLQREFEAQPVLHGEQFLLDVAIANLLQNALEFSPDGGTVTVRVGQTEEDITVTIDDEGPGVPDYARERVFDRFYSLQHPATGRKSSGLGLCFVKEAAELHRGTAKLENREEGGARATLTIPK